MTDEEKAEEYIKNVRTEWENQTYWVDCTDEVKQAYLDGLTEGRKEKCIIEQNKDGTIKLCDIAKENKELLDKLNLQNQRLNELKKENEELKKEISVLLSCANCSENKGGYICDKEYNDKCLSQKIEYIKELNEENTELEKQIEKMKG